MAVVSSDFAAFVADSANRADAKRVLIRGYFAPAEQVALAELVGLPAADAQPGDAGIDRTLVEEVVRRGREASFTRMEAIMSRTTLKETGTGDQSDLRQLVVEVREMLVEIRRDQGDTRAGSREGPLIRLEDAVALV